LLFWVDMFVWGTRERGRTASSGLSVQVQRLLSMRSGTSSACSGVAARISFRCAGLYEFSRSGVHSLLVCICMQAGAHLSSLPSSSLEPLSAAEGRAVNAQRTPSADSGTVWGKPPGLRIGTSATILRILTQRQPEGAGHAASTWNDPAVRCCKCSAVPSSVCSGRRRGGRWLPIAGLRARAAASQVCACTFAERRFSPALHGLGVTGHEPDGPRILSDSTGRTASSSERFA